MTTTPFTNPGSGLRDSRPELQDARDGSTRPARDPRLFWLALTLAVVALAGWLAWWA